MTSTTKIDKKLEKLQEKCEQKAYMYQDRYFKIKKNEFNWGKFQHWLGRAKGINIARQELRLL